MNPCALVGWLARLVLQPRSSLHTIDNTPETRRRVLGRLRDARALLDARAGYIERLIDVDAAAIAALGTPRAAALRRTRRDKLEELRILLCKRRTRIGERVRLQAIGLVLWQQEASLVAGATLQTVAGALETGAAYAALVGAELEALDVDGLVESFAEHQDIVNSVAETLAGVDELAAMTPADIDEHLAELCAEQGIQLTDATTPPRAAAAAAASPLPALAMHEDDTRTPPQPSATSSSSSSSASSSPLATSRTPLLA
jgi:hypothetical protein